MDARGSHQLCLLRLEPVCRQAHHRFEPGPLLFIIKLAPPRAGFFIDDSFHNIGGLVSAGALFARKLQV